MAGSLTARRAPWGSMVAPSWMLDATPTRCGRRIGTLARLEACNRHFGKGSERINECPEGRGQWPGGEDRCRRGERIGAGMAMLKRGLAYILAYMMCVDPVGYRTPPRLAAACEHLDHDQCARHSAGKGKPTHLACPWRYPAALVGRVRAERR